MDLTGISTFKTAYAFNDVLGTVTITFSDISGMTVYGAITIEAVRHRALADAIATVAKIYVPDGALDRAGFKTVMRVNQNEATTDFA